MTWAEAYELANQLQEIQSSSGDIRLSDRNCVELVSILIEKNFLDLFFTQDGREYITRKQLYTEVEQELEYAKGRITLLDLCDTLNVSIENVEPIVKDLVAENSTLFFVNSEIIQKKYIETISMETNLKLQENGFLPVMEICTKYDLPVHFIHDHISVYIGSLIDGFYSGDKSTLLTTYYQRSQRAKIQGALLGTTKPISLKTLSHITNVSESFLISTFAEFLAGGEKLDGTLDGGLEINSVFIPNCFLIHQKESVKSMLNSTGMAKFSQIMKLAIADPKKFISTHCADTKIEFLSDCCVSSEIIAQASAVLEQTMCDSTWTDLAVSLPSELSEQDVLMLFDICVSLNQSFKKELSILCDSVVVSNQFVSSCEKVFHNQIREKASLHLKENFLAVEKILTSTASFPTSNNSRKEDRKQKALGKKQPASGTKQTQTASIGGRGGREAKTKKAVKNKFKRNEDNNASESDEEATDNKSSSASDSLFGDVLKMTDIEKLLSEKFADELPPNCDAFCSSLAEQIFDPLKNLYEQQVKEEFEKTHVKKCSVSDMQNCVKEFVQHSSLIEKALTEFKKSVHYEQIELFCIKTLCNDALNNIINLVLDEYGYSLSNPSDLTPEARPKLLTNVKDETRRRCLLGLCKKFESFSSFAQKLENCCEKCDVYIGKLDKKKEKLFLSESLKKLENGIMTASTMEQLLHQSCLYLFQKHFKVFIDLPGKFVSDFMEVLKPKLDLELYETLSLCQKHVIDQKQSKTDNAEENAELNRKDHVTSDLEELFKKLQTNVLSIQTNAS